jgi:hypothetical protein
MPAPARGRTARSSSAASGHERGIPVSAIVDVPSGEVVTNDYAQITLDLSTEWREFSRDGAPVAAQY